ncbi:unnamed protein product [Clavelina lepadiformis]|uniref:Caspase-8 n=1 Tax=Clavelina lepadiformis TaxID=159417 RepID=A0ABP0F7X4_CLALP
MSNRQSSNQNYAATNPATHSFVNITGTRISNSPVIIGSGNVNIRYGRHPGGCYKSIDSEGSRKAKLYYKAIALIDNREWVKFARTKLALEQNVIEDIQYDNVYKGVEEQKYQMVLRWERNQGLTGTPDQLTKLINDFCQGPLECIDGPPSMDQASFRKLLLKISQGLTPSNVCDLTLFHSINDRQFNRGSEFLFYVEDNDLWGSTDNLEKVAILKGLMEDINRTDLCEKVDKFCQDLGCNRGSPQNSRVFSPSAGVELTKKSHDELDAQREETGSSSQPSCSSSTPETNPQASWRVLDFTSGQNVRQQISSSSETFMDCDDPTAGASTFQQFISSSIGNISTTDTGSSTIRMMPGNITVNSGTGNIIIGQSTQNTRMGGNDVIQSSLRNICSFEGSCEDLTVSSAQMVDYENHKTNINNIYPIRNKPKGHVLILNNINFRRSRKRDGAIKDGELMKTLFQKLDLKVSVERDKTAREMKQIVKEFASQEFHASADMCVIFVMSHGGIGRIPTTTDRVDAGPLETVEEEQRPQPTTAVETDVVYGVDEEFFPAEDIVRCFDNDNCEHLRGKPKLFFFQMCRGSQADRGVIIDAPDCAQTPLESLNRLLPKYDRTDAPSEHRPTREDILIAFATQKGNCSFRSWFTNAIANVFSKKARQDHVCDMLKEVKRGLGQRISSVPDDSTLHECKVMADVRDILLKNVYFFPGFP